MLRICIGLTVLLAGQLGQAFGQSGGSGRVGSTPPGREASERPRSVPSKPTPTMPRTQAEQPVTPASDYYPYDRRTGGM